MIDAESTICRKMLDFMTVTIETNLTVNMTVPIDLVKMCYNTNFFLLCIIVMIFMIKSFTVCLICVLKLASGGDHYISREGG